MEFLIIIFISLFAVMLVISIVLFTIILDYEKVIKNTGRYIDVQLKYLRTQRTNRVSKVYVETILKEYLNNLNYGGNK